MASTSSPKPADLILIRPATLNDIPKMGDIAFAGYAGSPLEIFLAPLRPKYPEDARRGWTQRMMLRWFDPRMISYIAHPASDPNKIIGYTQFSRLGDDDGARRQIASRTSLWFRLQGQYYAAKSKIMDYFWPDRSTDRNALKLLDEWSLVDDAQHWNPEKYPERQNRWYTRSIVVDPEWRGKGIGTKLMSEVIQRAREEGVVIGLEASEDGEYLYRKVGFELLGRFYNTVGTERLGDSNSGGIMMWRPEKMKSV